MTITPHYHDLFDGVRPTIPQLLQGIPSLAVLNVLSMLNAELYTHKQGLDIQYRLFDLMTLRLNQDVKSEILTKAQSRVHHNNGEEVAFFSTIYNLEFIHFELLNYRDIPMVDITPELDLNLLKAYFLIVEEINNIYAGSINWNAHLDQEYFCKMVWPTLLEQFEINQRTNSFTTMVKGFAFFTQLEYQTPFGDTVKNFLNKAGKSSVFSYVQTIISVMLTSQNVIKADGFEFANYGITGETGINTLLDIFSIKPLEYQASFKDNKANYVGVRDKPLIKTGDDYLVLNWNFLSNKLYDGLLFDFYKNSGIKKNKKFKDLPAFKQYISEEITEGYLFKKLMTELFSQQNGVLQFDDRKQIDNHPDCYFRKGNNILLIEIKDAYFPADAVTSISFETIKGAIDTKYNNDIKGKGTPQIIKQLKLMIDNSFEPESLNLKIEELNIYPVIIYTDGNFNLPGINDYLSNELELKIQDSGVKKHYKTIRPLTFININFFIDQLVALQHMEKDLFTLINAYHQQITILKGKFHLDPENDVAFLDQYNPFEKIVYWLFTEEFKKSGGYMKSIEKILGSIEEDIKNWQTKQDN